MELLTVKPIHTRNWKKKMDRWELIVRRDKNRKKSQERVDERIHYLWFHYLKLCLNLEEMNYYVEKKGGRGKVISKIKVKVKKTIYKKWGLNDLYTMSFSKWYEEPKHQKLFQQGGFTPTRGTQYHSLVKRYNVFIEYFNGRTGDYDKDIRLCENIIKKSQKVRFDLLKKEDKRYDQKIPKSLPNVLIYKDFKSCEKTILACCNGEFPKSR